VGEKMQIRKAGRNRFVRYGKTILLFLLISSMLIACGPQDSVKEATNTGANKTVVNYWYWLDDPSNNTFEQLIQKYNAENKDVQVVGRLIPFNDFQQTLINSIAANDAPDASKFKDWWVGQFTETKLLEELDKYTKDWKSNADIDKRYWDMGRTAPSSPIYMLPHQFITFYLYYRKDLFEKSQLSPPKTFDEFLAAAKKLTDPSKQQYGFAYRGGGGGQDQWYAFMLAGGARMQDDKGNVVINNETAVKVNQWYTDLFKEHKVSPATAVSDSYAQLIAGFQAGTTAMLAHHIGSYETLSKSLGDKLGVVPMPQADPSHPATMGTMTGNVVYKSSKSKDATWKFLSWLSGPEATDILSRSSNGQLPVLKSLVSKPEYQQKNIAWKVALDSEEFAHVWPPLKGVGTVAGHTWKDASDQALFGKITSKQMLDQLTTTLNEK
jgi:multiple sugar transport system substrate-binding protein